MPLLNLESPQPKTLEMIMLKQQLEMLVTRHAEAEVVWLQFSEEIRMAITEIYSRLIARASKNDRTSRMPLPMVNKQSQQENASFTTLPACNLPSENSELPSMNDKLPSVKSELPSVNGKLPSVNDKLPSVNDKLPSASSELPSVNDELPSVNDELPSVNGKLPSVNSELPSVNNKLASVNSELPSENDKLS